MAASLPFDAAGEQHRAAAVWPDRALDLSAAAALALLPFQNSFLQSTPLGGFGAPLSLLPLALFAFFGLLGLGARSGHIVVPPAALFVLAYVGLVTVGGLVVYGFSYKGVSLLSKAAMAAAQWGSLGLAAAAGMRCRPALARPALTFAWLANLAGLLLLGGVPSGAEERSAPYIGFSSEPSQFGVVTAMVGLALAYLTRRAVVRWCVLLSTAAALLVSGSKGAVATLGIVIVIVGLVRARNDPRRLLSTVPVLVVIAGGLFSLALSRIQVDIANFTSTVTRLSGLLTSLHVAGELPLGAGLGGFYPAFATTVPRTWPMIQALLGVRTDFAEVFSFAYSDDRNLSAKALLFDTLIYFGWPGAVALLAVSGRLAWQWLTDTATPRAVWLAMALAFAAIAMSTYNTVMPMYVIPMTFGFAWAARRA